MNKSLSVIRMLVLFILGIIAFILLFGEEQGEHWLLRFFCDKMVAFGMIYLIVRLNKRWSQTCRWFINCEWPCDEDSK